MCEQEGGPGRIALVHIDPQWVETRRLHLSMRRYECVPILRSPDDAGGATAQLSSVDAIVVGGLGDERDVRDVVAWARRANFDAPIIASVDSHAARTRLWELGIRQFLTEPWTSENLQAELRRRLRCCVDCALPLPLIHAANEPSATKWVCAACGSRYFGLLDETVHPDVRGNLRPARDSL